MRKAVFPLLLLIAVHLYPIETPEMINIVGDYFMMGKEGMLMRSSELTEDDTFKVTFLGHVVILSNFYIGKYEVTVGQFKEFVDTTGYTLLYQKQKNKGKEFWKQYEGKDAHPMGYLAYDDMLAYCQWLSDNTGQRYRLPTEAEWEYAARGQTNQQFPWGNEYKKLVTDLQGKTIHDFGRERFPVTVFPEDESPFGVRGMYGGGEAVLDCYDEGFYIRSPLNDPLNTSGTELTRRGELNGYTEPESMAFGLINRSYHAYDRPSRENSFRVVRETDRSVFNPDKPTACEYYLAKGRCNDSRVRIRTEPNLESKTLDYLEPGEEIDIHFRSMERVNIDGYTDYWYRVIAWNEVSIESLTYTTNVIGWVFGQFIDLDLNPWYCDQQIQN